MADYPRKATMPKKFGADDEQKTRPLNANTYKMALFQRDDPSDLMLFHYNPTTWSDTRQTKYEEEEVSEWEGVRPQYDGTGQRIVTMTLFFDDFSLGDNMPEASGRAGWRGPNVLTHGVRYNVSPEKSVHALGSRGDRHVRGGTSNSTRGMRPTQGSIEWLRMRSMTIPGLWDSPPILVFNGLKHHRSPKLFTCVITKVDITPLVQRSYNPWIIKRANVDIELKEFLESPI